MVLPDFSTLTQDELRQAIDQLNTLHAQRVADAATLATQRREAVGLAITALAVKPEAPLMLLQEGEGRFVVLSGVAGGLVAAIDAASRQRNAHFRRVRFEDERGIRHQRSTFGLGCGASCPLAR